MTTQQKNELESIKRELQSMITELESISWGVKKDFSGIGSEQCGACLDTVLNRYYTARNKLNYLDTNTLTDSFAKSHGLTTNGGSAW